MTIIAVRREHGCR